MKKFCSFYASKSFSDVADEMCGVLLIEKDTDKENRNIYVSSNLRKIRFKLLSY